MKIVSTSYISVNEETDPQAWLRKISYYTGVFEELAKSHHVTSFERIGFEGEINRLNVNYRFIRLTRKSRKFPVKMHKEVDQLKPDIVLVHGLHFPFQLLQLRFSLHKKAKIFLQHHAEKPARGWKKYFQRMALNKADGYFFTSLKSAEEWQEQGLLSDMSKVYEVMEASSRFAPISKEKARARTGVTGEETYLWVGRLNENKDPLTLLNAFESFLRQNPLARLFIIYQEKDMEAELKRRIGQSVTLKTNTKLIGRIDHTEMLYWYNSCDFIISTSFYEGSGVAVCEAMSCGCIPVLSRIPSFIKMSDGGNCGFLFEPGEPADLVRVLVESLSLDKAMMKEKVLTQFRRELSFEAIARKMDQAFTSA
jgi:glycosyltransferase involved in cell wall biosynthesis